MVRLSLSSNPNARCAYQATAREMKVVVLPIGQQAKAIARTAKSPVFKWVMANRFDLSSVRFIGRPRRNRRYSGDVPYRAPALSSENVRSKQGRTPTGTTAAVGVEAACINIDELAMFGFGLDLAWTNRRCR